MADGLNVASLFGTIDLVDKLTPGLNKAKGSLSGFARDMGSQLSSMGTALTVGLTVPIVGFLGASVKAASDNQNALTQLNQVIKSTGGAAGVTAKQAEALAESLAKTTRFSKDTTLSTENLLLTFTSIGKDIFPDVTKSTLDMSQALGQDTKSSAIQLGKALQDPIKGVGALRRVGVEFTDAQKKQIEQLVKSGKVMEAQKIILKEIQREFGGSAEAAGTTFAGKMDILNHAFTDFQEKVGYIIIPLLEKFMGFISNLVDGLNKLNPNILQIGVVAAIAAAAIGPVLGILGGIATVIGVLLSPIGLLVAAIGALALAFATNFGGIRDTVMNVVNLLAPGFKRIIEAVQTFVSDLFAPGKADIGERFSKAVTDAWPKLVDGAQTLLRNIGAFISDNFPKVVKAFEDILGKVGDWFSSGGLGKLALGLGDMIGKAANWFITDGWPMLKKGVEGLWKGIQDFLASDGAKKFQAGLLEVIREAGNWIITTGWPTLKTAVGQLVDLIIAEFGRIAQGIVDSISRGINNAKNAITGQGPATPVSQAQHQAQNVLNFGGGIGGALNFFGFAGGGDVTGGKSIMVGEKGPEIFTPGSGGHITPNSALGGGPSTLHIVFNADDFTKHLYINIADAMHAGMAR